MPSKAAVARFVKAVRAHDLTAVRAQLADDPLLLKATAKAPPKKDDGQSPLQIALKTGRSTWLIT